MARYKTIQPIVTANVISDRERIHSFDGLRGVAAFVVIIYHYLCLVHPSLTTTMATSHLPILDTPVNLLFNGAFAVAIFFVLSGYVIARSADWRHDRLLQFIAARYIRLALPAMASCILAWVLLTMMPDAALSLAAKLDDPSRWLNYTYQGDLNFPLRAAYNGFVGIFNYGFSRWNNALWTLKIELFGSIAIFMLYTLGRSRLRMALLVLGTLIMPALTEPSYAAFGLGAGIYEATRTNLLNSAIVRARRGSALIGTAILVVGLLMAFPGSGFHARTGLPEVIEEWEVGQSRGYVYCIAATLTVIGVLLTTPVNRVLSTSPLLWLGRVSFSLYLVHVPILYTLIATLHLESSFPSPVILGFFVIFCLGLAEVFTRIVDMPTIRISALVRQQSFGKSEPKPGR